jgi:outer membrane protein insertion porin family
VGGTLEVQFPLGLPPEIGLRGALFADAGTLTEFRGKTVFLGPGQGNTLNCPGSANFQPNMAPNCITLNNETGLRSSVGASLLWAF